MADGSPVDMPLVSIVIPVYNGANFLAEAIDSALAQTYPRVEVVVVDDGSDDDGATERICAGYGRRIRYFYKVNGGVATALNYGIQVMRGRFFSWLSHDDIYAPDRIAIMVAEHRGRATTQSPLILSSDTEKIDHRGTHLRFLRPQHRPGLIGEHAAVDWGPNGCSLLIPRECFDRAGLLHPRLPTTQDADMWVRMRRVARFEHVPVATVRSRDHDDQGSRTGWHLAETVLNRLSVLDRLDSGFIRDPEPDPVPRYRRLLASPAMKIRQGVHQNVRLRLGRAIRQQSVALLCAVDMPLAGEVVERMRTAGLRVSVVRLRDVQPAAVIAACAALDADLVWLWDRPIAAPVATLRWMLERLLADPAAAGCVHEAGARRAGAVFGAFHGALLPARLFRDLAFVELSDPWLALAHAAVQQGGLALFRREQADEADVSGLVAPDPREADPLPAEVALYERSARSEAPGGPGWTLGGRRVGWLSAVFRWTRIRARARARARTGPGIPTGGPTRIQAAVALIARYRRLAKLIDQAIWRSAACTEVARMRLLRVHGLAGHFDPAWYLRAYPDVACVGIDPLLHYLTEGHRELRDPSAGFSTLRYLEQHPDVAARGLHPLQHYALWGRFESRRVCRSTRVEANDRNAGPAYACSYPAVLLAYDGESPDAGRLASDLGAQLRRHTRPILLSIDAEGGCRPRDLRDDAWLAVSALSGSALDACLGATSPRRMVIVAGARAVPALVRLPQRLGIPHEVLALGPPEQFEGGLSPAVLRLIATASGVHALSSDIAGILRSRADAAAVKLAPLPDPGRLGWVRPWPRNIAVDECCRVALFGTPHRLDGHALLVDVLKIVHAHGLPFVFALYGPERIVVPASLRSLFLHVPVTSDEERTHAVARFHPHVAWIPYARPARALMPLADAARSALPIAACDSSDARSYLAGRPLTWLLSSGSDARRWLDLLYRICHVQGSDPWRPKHPLEGFCARDGELAASLLRNLRASPP